MIIINDEDMLRWMVDWCICWLVVLLRGKWIDIYHKRRTSRRIAVDVERILGTRHSNCKRSIILFLVIAIIISVRLGWICWPIERFCSISLQFIITFSWGHINISSDKQIGLHYWVLHSSDHYYSELDSRVTFNFTSAVKELNLGKAMASYDRLGT